jgi:hypothetical protein
MSWREQKAADWLRGGASERALGLEGQAEHSSERWLTAGKLRLVSQAPVD